jgi:hypothetical protein
MLVKYYKKSKEFDIEGGYEYGDLYSSFELPIEYRDKDILSNLNVEYNILEVTDKRLVFDSSPFYEFYMHEGKDIILVSENINSILEEIKSFEVDYVSVSIVMTFGQVPSADHPGVGRTMFENIKSFKGNTYFEIDVENNIYEFKIKKIKPNFDLWDKDYFLEYYKQKLEKIGDYTIFYSPQGTDSNFLKFVNPEAKLYTFDYHCNKKNYYELFKTLNGIDIHSLIFPCEYHVWNSVEGKIIAGRGGDETFGIRNYGDYTIDEVVRSSGVNTEDCDLKDLEVLESFIDDCKTLVNARAKCGGGPARNTASWAHKNSNSLVFNPLLDPVVRETFKYEPHDYSSGKRFLNKFVDFGKDVTPFNMDYWEDFYSESIDKITNKYVYDKSDWEDDIYKQNNQMKFLVELYYNSKDKI